MELLGELLEGGRAGKLLRLLLEDWRWGEDAIGSEVEALGRV